REVIGHILWTPESRNAGKTRVLSGLPRIPFVSPLVVPSGKVHVIVLAAGLEEMRVVGDELRNDAGTPQRICDRVLPELDRAPGAPKEVPGAAQDVVTRGDTRKR